MEERLNETNILWGSGGQGGVSIIQGDSFLSLPLLHDDPQTSPPMELGAPKQEGDTM